MSWLSEEAEFFSPKKKISFLQNLSATRISKLASTKVQYRLFEATA